MYSSDPIEILITILILQQITRSGRINFRNYFGQDKNNTHRQRKSSQDDLKRKKPNDSNDSSQGKKDSTKSEPSRHIVVHDRRLNEHELKKKVELQRENGQLRRKLPLVNGITCQLEDEDHIAEVKSMRGVKRVDEDLTLEIKSPNTKLKSNQSLSEDVIPWGIKVINTLDAWTDSKVNVGVIDTGIYLNHFDLVPINQGYNTINADQQPNDPHGHGTHVAGTIAARKNDEGVVGVAPNIELYPVKAFNEDGSAKMSSLIEALQWSIENNIKVLNMSFGVGKDNDTLQESISKTHQAGITMIAAAGNDGADTIDFPARYSEVIAVGAINENKELADFSNYGTNLDVVAPGVNIASTWKNGQFNKLDGTSMATPHVAGLTALILSTFKNMTPSKIKKTIKQGATPLKSIDSIKQGAGLVNAAKTIEILKK